MTDALCWEIEARVGSGAPSPWRRARSASGRTLSGRAGPGFAAVAERLLQSPRVLHASEQTGSSPPLTVGIGTATLVPTAATCPSDLVALADTALYTAKPAGRDKVVAAS